MIDHTGTQATDYDATRRFYLSALAPLGFGLQSEMVTTWDAEFPTRRMCAFGPAGKPAFWIVEAKEPSTPQHVAFAASDQDSVIAFHRAALEGGGRDNGPPGLRPVYHPGYFGAFALDPEGNNVEAVCHGATARRTVLRYLREVWNERKLAVADELIAASYDPEVLPAKGPEGARELVRFFLAAFPDFSIDVLDVVAEGDRVVVRYDFAGTHRGDWMGVAPTGKRVQIMGTTTYRVADGKITDTWFSYDALGLLQQLGAFPPAGRPSA